MRLAVLLLVGCARIVHDPVAPAVDRVVEPCIATKPPKQPDDVGCTFDDHECRDLHNAMWSDYAQELRRWVELYVLPTCRVE